MIFMECTPPGVLKSTVSPAFRPRSALPRGDSLEMRPDAGEASVLPTIVYVSVFLPLSACTRTIEPTSTTSDFTPPRE